MKIDLLNSKTDNAPTSGNSVDLQTNNIDYTSSSALKVGEIGANGNYILSMDTEKIKNVWEKMLNDEMGISTRLTHFSIQSGFDEGFKTPYYYILGMDNNGTNRLATQIYINGHVLYMPPGPHLTCSCSGCAYGCNPYMYKGRYFCDNDCGSNCNKSVSTHNFY